MDYASKSIMQIVEEHLSPTPQYSGNNQVGSSSPIERALNESEKEFSVPRREAIRRELNGRRYG